MSSSNPLGKVKLIVCDEELVLTPTYRAIDNITMRLDRGTPALLNRVAGGDPRHKDFVVIVEEGLRGSGIGGQDGRAGRFTTEQIGEDVRRNFYRYLPAIIAFLINCNGGPADESKKDEPPVGPTTEPEATGSQLSH